jgi:3-oxoacyl-[acyl-carrier-protein] synthase III
VTVGVRLESLGISAPRKRRSLAHAVRAGKDCLAGSAYHPHDVAVLINAGVYRDEHYAEPAFACFIQDKLGINVEFQGRQTLSFDLLNGGCGLLSATAAVVNLIRAGTFCVGMAIASEANSDRRPDPSWDVEPSGAALLLDVSPRSDAGFGEFVFVADDAQLDRYTSSVVLDRKNGRLVLRKDEGLEQEWLRLASEAFDELLHREGLDRDAIDRVVPAQLSPAFVGALPEALGMPADRVEDRSDVLGHTLTTSWALALHGARERGAMAAGQRVVVLAFGSGLTAGAALYRC